jgi:hypothetical protein
MWQKKGELPQKYATIRCSFAATHTPLLPVPTQSTHSPHHWQCGVCLLCNLMNIKPEKI